MTALTSNQIIKSKLKLLFGNAVNINSEKDRITIQSGDSQYFLEFDEDEINSELSNIKEFDTGFIMMENQINFLLFDNMNQLETHTDLEIIGEISRTARVRIKKDKKTFGLLVNNLELVAGTSYFKANESLTLDEIIDDKVVICEVTFDSPNLILKEEINDFIESLRAHLSYSNNIFLDNPRMTTFDTVDKNEINTDIFTFNLIKDSEPLTYFLFAESVEHLHLKFLEYYHVLEYYFLHKRIKDVEVVIKNLLAMEMTKKKSDDKKSYYKDLINLFDSYFQKEDKNSKESEQLEYVLLNDLGYDLIKHALNNIDINLGFINNDACGIKSTGLNTDKKIFVGKKLLNCSDTELTDVFCKKLANRIYKIRNYIVHSKKYEHGEVFTPSASNLKLLVNEVKLLRVIAYTLLNKSE